MREYSRKQIRRGIHRLRLRKVDVGPNYDWEREAQSDGLDEATRSLLRRDGLAIAGPDFEQSFSVYGDESHIPLVTSAGRLGAAQACVGAADEALCVVNRCYT